MRGAVWLVLALGGCGAPPALNGVRPGPVGEPAVVLWAEGDAAVPIACYDPLWVERRGPADCADLVPPGAIVRALAGGVGRVTDRGPLGCGHGVRLALATPLGGWAVWPPALAARPDGAAVVLDLDDDGAQERVEPWGCAVKPIE